MKVLTLGVAASLLAALACGGDGGNSGTGPERVLVATVTVTPALDTVVPGQTLQLSASVRSSRGDAIEGRGITWTSTSNAIATVSSSGLVTGVGEGAVTIVASVDGVPGSSAITARFPFPNGAGSYSISGTFNTDPSTFSGTVTLVQASRLAGALTGSATGTLLSSDGSRNTVTGLTSAAIDEDGDVSFILGTPAGTSEWSFAGRLMGDSITGTHILRINASLFSGSWQGTRTGPLAEFGKAPRATR